MSRSSHYLFLLLAALLMFAPVMSGCAGTVHERDAGAVPPPQPPPPGDPGVPQLPPGGDQSAGPRTILVVPDSATLPPGGTQEFEVYLTGDIFGTGAFFELNQPEHGTMHIGERAAIYVAPAVPGNYQIRFFSIVDPSVDFIVPVVVTP